MDIRIDSSIKVTKTSHDGNIEKLTANVSLFPRSDDNTRVLYLTTDPEYESKNNTIILQWKEKNSDIKYSISSKVQVDNAFVSVGKKIKFPIENLPKEYVTYTKPTEKIDSNNYAVISKASEIAEGQDDLFVIVHELASWTEDNMKYDLGTLTANVVQKASWVLQNKQGACDELTNLFMAMARSLGIPARYVSGVAYTNYNDLNDWGPHAWAEVYFPDYGWVPFDIAYRQFGFVDATHIKLKTSLDSAEPSTNYEWLSTGVELEPQALDIKVSLKGRTGEIDPFVDMNIAVQKDRIGFGSYNLVEVEAKNLKSSYVPTELYLVKSKEVEILGNERRQILLKPNEIKKEYWLIKLTDNLEKGYTYTFPISITTNRNESIHTRFVSNKDDPLYSYDSMYNLIKELREETQKTYSGNLEFNCMSDKNEYYSENNSKIKCELKNTGNMILKNMTVCVGTECYLTDINIMQSKSINFTAPLNKIGRNEAKAAASNQEVSKIAYVKYSVLDAPLINISELSYPEKLLFDDEKNIEFKIEKMSFSDPQSVEITLSQKGYSEKWKIDRLNETRRYSVKLRGSDLNSGMNEFVLKVAYKDKDNKSYEQKTNFSLTLNEVNPGQQIILFFNSIGRWLESLMVRG